MDDPVTSPPVGPSSSCEEEKKEEERQQHVFPSESSEPASSTLTFKATRRTSLSCRGMSVTIQEDDSQGKVATDVANGDNLSSDTVMKEWEKEECHADKNNNNKKCQQEEMIPVAGCSSWSISSPFTMSKPSTTSGEGPSHPPLPTGELPLGVPAPEVDVIEDKVFKSFESLEEMEQFTKAEEANKKMRQQVEDMIRRQRRRSNATKAKSRTVVPKTSLDLPLPPIPSEASGSASSVFASNLLDEYLSKTKKELKSNYPKPTLVGCPPEGSKIYDTGILAKESVKKGGKVSSVLPFGDLSHLKKTQQPKSPLHEVTDNHFNHPLDYQSKSSVTQKSGVKTSLSPGKRAPFKSSSNPSLPLVKRKKIIMGNKNRTVVRSTPMVGDKLKKQMIEVPDNLNISPYLKDASFARQNEQSWQDWKRRSLISHDISFEMDLGYVNFALDVLADKGTGLSNSQKKGKRKKGYVYEDDYDFLGPSTSKKSSDRGASEEIALASMISRHSKRDIKLPSRYHDSGLMVGGQWIIPGPTIETTSTISPAKTNEAKSEKKARKTLFQEQERLRKTKTCAVSIPEPPPPPSDPARAIKEKKKREKRPRSKLEAPPRNNKIGNVQTQVVNRNGVRWKITTPIPHDSEDGDNPSKTSQLRQFRHPPSAPPVPNVPICQVIATDKNRTRNESAIQTTFPTSTGAFLAAFPAQLPQKPPSRGRPPKIKIGKVGRPILPSNMNGRLILPKTSELDTKMVPLSQVSFGSPPSEQQQTNCNSSTSPGIPAVIWNNQHLQVHQLPPRPSPALLNHQMQQQQWAAQQKSVCDGGLESGSSQQQHEPSVFGKDIYELKELYRNLFFINRPERRPYYQKMGMKPRVNKQLVLEEAIDVIEKEEKKFRQLQYAHKLSILWQRKLYLCKKVITGETKIPNASLKDIIESVEKVLKTYQDSAYVTKICPHLDRTSPPSSRHSSISEGQLSSEIASLTEEVEAEEISTTTTSLPQMPKLIPATSTNGENAPQFLPSLDVPNKLPLVIFSSTGGTAIKPSSTDATIPKIIMPPHEVQISSLPPPPPLMVNGHHSSGGDSKVVEIVRPLITGAVTVTPNDNKVPPVNKKKILTKKGKISLLMPRSMSVEEVRMPHVNGDGGGDESVTVDHNDPNDLAGSFRPLSFAITANRFTYSNIRIKGGKIVSQRPSC